MPVFPIPRAQLEVEVSRLEQQGYRPTVFTVAGAEVIVYAPPLWRDAAPRETRPAWPEQRHVLERTDLGQTA